MKKIILKSKNIIIKNLKLTDINNKCLKWFEDKEIKKFVIYSPKNSLKKLRSDSQKIIKNKNEFFLGIFTHSLKHVGNIRLYDIDKKKGKSGLGILLGDKNFRGKGFASDAIKLCADFLYDEYNISKIFLGTKSKNLKAIRLYKNSGFIIYKRTKKDTYFFRDYFKSKISIGAAQIGLDYGIANNFGQMKIQELKKIKKDAIENGINTIDTAPTYGNSEKILGKIGVSDMNIITKIPIQNPKKNINNWMIKSIKRSLKNLKIKKLNGVLIHNTKQLEGKIGKEIYKSLRNLKKRKLVNKIGIAVYSPSELSKILKKFNFDIISIPFNMFDQRFRNSGLIDKMKKMSIEIHARSIFLQGLLLLKKNKIPKFFLKWGSVFSEWDTKVKKTNRSRLENCINFTLNEPKIDKIILGFDNSKQFKEVINKFSPFNRKAFCIKKLKPISLVNPTKWKIL